jgi:TonB-dependent receptor
MFLASLAISWPAHAQTGSMSGHITSKSNGETIPGANVLLLGTTIGASTDLDGNYTINYIPVGNYSVIVSFISYKTDTIPGIRIEKGKAVELNIELEDVTVTLEGVTITARKTTNTEISMISTIKQSNLIVNGVSAMQISKSQDKDAAEVVRRVPGVTIMEDRFVYVRGLAERYNSVWLNNTASPSTETDQRAFSFDVIPSHMIDNILVYKTPAPELPSDFAGATIQIHTKNVTDKNSLGLSYQAAIPEGVSFNEFYRYQGGKTDWMGFDDGTRKLPSEVLTTSEMQALNDFADPITQEEIDYQRSELNRIARTFTEISTAETMRAPIDNRFVIDLTYANKSEKVRISNITSLNYKFTFDTDTVMRSTFEVYDTVNDRSVPIYRWTDSLYKNDAQLGGIHNWSFAFGKNIIEFRNLINQIGSTRTTRRYGDDYYRGSNVHAYELGYVSRTIYSGQLSGSHRSGNDDMVLSWTAGFSYGGKNEPDVRRIYTTRPITNTEPKPPFSLEYAYTANTESNGRLFSEVQEFIYTGLVDWQYTFSGSTWKPTLRVGLYYEDKSRDFSQRTFGIARAARDNFNYHIQVQPLDSVYADTNFNFTNGIKLIEDTRPDYHYFASSNTLAGYIGVKIPILNRLNLYGGIRAEKFDRQLGEWQTPQEIIDSVPDVILDTFNIYPSVILTYNITNDALLRLSYGKTVNRPEYREIAPYAFYDFEQSATVYGNPDLLDCYIQNVDLRFEWYPTPIIFLNVGAFYKYFKNPIELNLFPASNGWDFVAVNSIDAVNYGAEFEGRLALSIIRNASKFAEVMKRLTLSLNAAYIYGEVNKEGDYLRDKQRALYGQSPYVINAGLYYQDDIRGWSGSLLYNSIGSRIVIVGTPSIPNVYEMPRNLLDGTISKRFNEHLTVKFGVKNILNSSVIYRQTFDVTLVDQEGNSSTVERIQDIRRYSPQRTYYITLTYVL